MTLIRSLLAFAATISIVPSMVLAQVGGAEPQKETGFQQRDQEGPVRPNNASKNRLFQGSDRLRGDAQQREREFARKAFAKVGVKKFSKERGLVRG